MNVPQAHAELIDAQILALSDHHGQLDARMAAIQAAIEARLKDDGLNYHLVKGRVKEPDSIRGKLRKLRDDGSPKYPAGIDELDDIVGLRVITYIQPDVENVVKALTGQFKVHETVDKGAQMVDRGILGYAAHHLILEVDAQDTPSGCLSCVGQRFEVQVKTVLQHAWAEFEHDIRYKAAGDITPEINRAFTLASGLLELADHEFIKIHQAVAHEEQGLTEELSVASGEQLSAVALSELLVGLLPDHPRSRLEQYAWLTELLASLEVTSTDQAKELLSSADWHFVADTMTYKFPAGHVRIVDDYLLSKFGPEYIEKTQSVGDDPSRIKKLRYRLSKFRPSEDAQGSE
ncbi:GTP pyrophosphokinase [Psychromicrobium xiongbiense]|uniref:GTP pyrophosphokinase n=1 Tax=Psychromicrobium xiongbiense TaxID=3051184 RepID=UPI00255790BE|nr:hypothetical protein [Psychromicrobium sp. YIM S02556]